MRYVEIKKNIPDPFYRETEVTFYLLKPCFIKVTVLNMKGDIVGNIFEGYLNQGVHFCTWDATNHAKGEYYCYVESNDESEKIMMRKV